MKRTLTAGSILVFCVLICYWGLFGGSKVCWNLFAFTSWFTFVMAFFLFVPSITEHLRKLGRPIPAWLSIASDVAIILMLAATGHFGYAAFWTFSLIMETSAYATEKPVS